MKNLTRIVIACAAALLLAWMADVPNADQPWRRAGAAPCQTDVECATRGIRVERVEVAP